MTTMPTSPHQALENRADRRKTRAVAVAAATGAALAAWAFTEYALGVDLRSPAFDDQPSADVGPGPVLFMGAASSLAGWAALAVLERLTGRARTVWTVLAVAVFLLSLGGPFSGTDVSTGSRVGLAALHAVVAAVLIPLMRRSATTSRSLRTTVGPTPPPVP